MEDLHQLEIIVDKHILLDIEVTLKHIQELVVIQMYLQTLVVQGVELVR